VAKRSRWQGPKYDSLGACLAQMEVQSVASFLANAFNKASGKKVRDK
jgi:hypothetical protein